MAWASAGYEVVEGEDDELIPVTITGFVAREHRSGHRREQWNRPPFGPAFPTYLGAPLVRRTNDTILVAPSMFCDRSLPGRHGIARGEVRAVIYRDGVRIDEQVTDGDLLDSFAVAPERATYRLDVEATRPPERFELSPRVTASWTFASQRSADGARRTLPLPVLRFTPPLDQRGRAHPWLPLLVPITVERPEGAAMPQIATVSADASFDDGATWQPLPLVRVGETHFALILHRPRTAFVSLRGTAGDVDGNRVEQTIVRAYGVAP